MIRALTGFSTRNPWKVIALWTLIGIFLSLVGQALAFRVTQSQSGDFLPDKYDSAAALKVAEERFGVKPDANAVTMLVARNDGKPLTEPDHLQIGGLAEKLGGTRVDAPKSDDGTPSFLAEDYSQTPKISPVMLAPDRSFELIAVELTGNSTDPAMQDLYRDFRDSTEKQFAEVGLRTGFTGGLADLVDTADAEEGTQKIVGALMFGLIIVINILVFRSVLAAIIPLLSVVIIGGAAAGVVVGTAMLTGVKLDPGTPSMISTVLIGTGVDYFLFLLFRFREQLRAHPGLHARTVAAEVSGRVGTAVTSAALTIVAAFATLGIATFGQFRVLGPAIAVSMLVMLFASLTLMPALLAVTGRKMFWPSRALRREPRPGAAARLGDLVARRPFTLVLASVAVLGALAAGMIGIRMDFGTTSGSDTAAAKTAAEVSRALPAGVSDPTSVYITAEGGRTLTAEGVAALPKALATVDGVGQVGETVFNDDRTAARVDVYLNVGSDTQQARDLVSGPVRDVVAASTPEGLEAHVGGTAAIFADISDAVDHDLKIVFPVAAVLITLILLLLLRSLLAPVILMISVGLGFAATLGASALFFQHLLDKPGVNFVLPLVLFLFVVALGTDYNILISDRIREEMEKPGPPRAAVSRAVRHTAPAIVTAGIVLAASFGSLAVTSSPSTQQIGFATALGIMLSAFVLSIVLVPALAAILGRGTWWPVRPRRLAVEVPAYEAQHEGISVR